MDLVQVKVIQSFVHSPFLLSSPHFSRLKLSLSSQAQESARPQLIAIERLMLESLCFNFNSNRPPVTAEELLGGTELVYFGVEDETSGGGAGGAGAGGGGKDVFGWVVRFGRSMGGESFLFPFLR